MSMRHPVGIPTGIGEPTPVLFLDIDGTVRKGKDELGKFVNSAGDVEVFAEVPELMLAYRRAGWKIAGITNQGGVALGIVAQEAVVEALEETIRQTGGLFDTVAVCYHHPEAEKARDRYCWCRKPKIGSLIQATHGLAAISFAHGKPEWYPPHLALMVGDRPEDEECAGQAGVRFMDARSWRSLAPTEAVIMSTWSEPEEDDDA